MQLNFDYQAIFQVMNSHAVQYLLIGGLNYFLRHRPVSTQDVDLFVESSRDNLTRCEAALSELDAEWGKVDDDWSPTRLKPNGWLAGQSVFCMLTSRAPLDIFLSVPGITSFAEANARAALVVTRDGINIRCISTTDLLACQMALPEHQRRQDRVNHLMTMHPNE